MNEIERAIKHFEGLQKRYTTQHNGKHCDLVATALEALREKAEREKGCAFCNTGAHRILQNALYCPRCGKRLEVEP